MLRLAKKLECLSPVTEEPATLHRLWQHTTHITSIWSFPLSRLSLVLFAFKLVNRFINKERKLQFQNCEQETTIYYCTDRHPL